MVVYTLHFMNLVSGLNCQIRPFKTIGNVEFTNQNFNNPNRQINSNSRLWFSLAVPNTTQPIPGWTLSGLNSSVYVCNGVTAFCRFVSNKVQYLFITIDKIPSSCTITQNINILIPGVYEVKFFICARLAFGNPTVNCTFNGNSVISPPSQDSFWTSVSNIVSINTIGTYPLEFLITQSQICISDVTIRKIS